MDKNKKIEELEKRVKDLEARPFYPTPMPYPVPYYPPTYPSHPIYPWDGTWYSNGTGTQGGGNNG